MTLLDPHLDIDQLSAAVDGTRDPAVAAHVLVCLACRQQVDTWRRTLAPLRALPAPPSDVDPVGAAMAAWRPLPSEDQLPAEGPLHPEDALHLDEPLHLEEVGAEPSGVMAPMAARPPRRHRNARLRRLQPPAGVAAALVALVLVAAAVIGIRAGGSGGPKSSSQAAVAPKAATAPSARLPLSSGLATSGSGRASVPEAVPAASSGGLTGASPSFGGTTQLAAELRRVVSSRPVASVKADTPCLRQARLDAAKVPAVATTSPTFTETVTFVNVPGQVFVFALTHGHVAVVVRSSTCSLLATVSF